MVIRMAERGKRARLAGSFQRHYQDLLRFLFHRTGDMNDAADLAQDTWVRLSRVQDQAIENDRAYIFRVAGNLVLDAHRRSVRRAGWFSDEEPDKGIVDHAPSQERLAIDRDHLTRLDAALLELPVKARLALMMLRVDGLSYAEIAARLGVSESMVGKYIMQAVRHCRDRAEWGDE
ncbi:RNA polymerase sigma factor [Gluconacetobacter sp.]|uniref:RNA polymerase sigma factor n=1 Tax=Gluconacetobacter sp. TaxID=1935994 RepID=UPI0039E7B627